MTLKTLKQHRKKRIKEGGKRECNIPTFKVNFFCYSEALKQQGAPKSGTNGAESKQLSEVVTFGVGKRPCF